MLMLRRDARYAAAYAAPAHAGGAQARRCHTAPARCRWQLRDATAHRRVAAAAYCYARRAAMRPLRHDCTRCYAFSAAPRHDAAAADAIMMPRCRRLIERRVAACGAERDSRARHAATIIITLNALRFVLIDFMLMLFSHLISSPPPFQLL